jgi:MFS family permease
VSVLYAALALVTLIIYAALSPRIEAVAGKVRVAISPETRRIIVRISALFSIDSLGGGFLTTALISFYFFERFHVSEAVIGLLFFGARLANAGSHLVAAWLSRRIGPREHDGVHAHPSSLLLVTVAFAPNFPVAVVLFLLREGLVEMDVPTRSRTSWRS